MRSEQETICAIDRYADMVRRICFVHLKSIDDTEDIFQEVFLKYALRSGDFEDSAHEKAWLIRVTINACRDLLRSAFRNRAVPLDELMELPAAQQEEHREVLEAVLRLPNQYKDVIYLHYYEGFSAAETGRILGKKVNTVYTLLARARKQLKTALGGDGFGE